MEGHVLAAAMNHFKIDSLDECPDSVLIESLNQMPSENRAAAFEKIAATIIEQYVDFLKPSTDNSPSIACNDGIKAYGKSLLCLSLLWAEFEDATKEGDGPRLVRCWKFLLILFKQGQRNNYAIEAFNMLVMKEILLSPRQSEQLVWSRFVNYSGRCGTNKAADLHMEHMNRPAKAALGNLRSNITPHTVTRVGKTVGPLLNITSQLDSMLSLSKTSGKHAAVVHANDLQKVVESLHTKARVFSPSVNQRKHASFNVKPSPFNNIDECALTNWMKQRFRYLVSS